MELNQPVLIGFAMLIVGFVVAFLMQKARFTGKVVKLETVNKELDTKINFLSEEKNKLTSEKAVLQKQYDELEKHLIRLQAEKDKMEGQLLMRLESERNNYHAEIDRRQQQLEEMKVQAEKNEKILQEKFQNLANRLLEETGERLSEKQSLQLKNIIEPFKEQLQEFKEKVEKTDKEQYGRIKALSEQINNLRNLNQQMVEEALNLTKALKGDTKVMGDWGEVTLRRLLELSGLEEGREYIFQQNFVEKGQDNKNYRPDVVVYLPGKKVLVIDAKVSIKHYTEYIHADDGEVKKRNLRSHLSSIKNHIKELSKKEYHLLEELNGKTPEFVLMFVPLEPAFALALKEEPGLYDEALRSNIVMVTPSTLLATLKVVESLWKTEKQHRNTQEIVKEAGNLYDKFVGFVQDLNTLGKKLEDAKALYDSSMNKLSTGKGNLIRKVENIKKLGLKTKKQLDSKLLDDAFDD